MSTLANGVVIDEKTWNSKNFTPSRSVPSIYGMPRVISGVTVHWWGEPSWNQKFNAVADYLSRPGGNTSAHFVVEDGRVACLISPENAAWHSGSAKGNATTIGIECRPGMSPGDLETLAYLIAWLEDMYGPLKVYGHRDWSATACPGTYYGKLSWVIDRVNQIHSGSKTITPAPSQNAAPAPATGQQTAVGNNLNAPHWTVRSGDSLGRIARYYFGSATPAEVKKIADYNGIKDANRISVGQRIFIPGPLVWTVQAGDTWEKVATYYGYSVQAVKDRNPGKSLTPGTVLVIWGAGER